MAKRELGDIVAASMAEIMDSETHHNMFGKTAKKKSCCDCEGKCGRKCPCKTKDGCGKACGPCKEMAKKASDKCCDCKGKCGDDCSCTECKDCAACGDKMMASSSFDMVRTLLALSELQDEFGLTKSAEATLRASAILAVELRKAAGSNEADETESSATGVGAAGQTSRDQPDEPESSATGVGAAGQTSRNQRVPTFAAGVGAAGQTARKLVQDKNDASFHGQVLDDETLGPDDLEEISEHGFDDPSTMELAESDPEMMALLQEMADRKRDREKQERLLDYTFNERLPTQISDLKPIKRQELIHPDEMINEGEEGMRISVDPDASPFSPTEYRLPKSKSDADLSTTEATLPLPAKMKAWEEAADYMDRIKDQQEQFPETRENIYNAKQSLKDLGDLPEDVLDREDPTMRPNKLASLEMFMSKFAEEIDSDEDEYFEDETDDQVDVEKLFEGSK